ncbi:hypothetical protein ACFE04_024272 [Oxalis oulophora]
MAANNVSNQGRRGEDESNKQMAELNKTLKEGERILGPTRRPDGTLRKPIRIRAGYIPQDEVAIYKSKGALLKQEMESQLPIGYSADMNVKTKSKSAKKNERKKEKRQQAALEKGKNLDSEPDEESEEHVEDTSNKSESVKSLTSQMNDLVVAPPSETTDNTGVPGFDIDKKIRALKKKIRLAEAQQEKSAQADMNPEQLEKLMKIEGWHEELKLMEAKKAELSSS